MADPDQLRSQAARLLAMAMKAYESGQIDSADILIARAMQHLDQADALDRSHGLDVAPGGSGD